LIFAVLWIVLTLKHLKTGYAISTDSAKDKSIFFLFPFTCLVAANRTIRPGEYCGIWKKPGSVS
jgi:hypothetical protein